MRNNCSSDREKLSKINAQGQEFAKGHLNNLFKQRQVLTIFGNNGFFPVPGGFSDLIHQIN